MRFLEWLVAGCAGGVLVAWPVAAQETAPPAAPAASQPQAGELIEGLRILAIVNVLQPTRDQSTRLAAVAVSGTDGLAVIEADVRAKLDTQRGRLLVERAKL